MKRFSIVPGMVMLAFCTYLDYVYFQSFKIDVSTAVTAMYRFPAIKNSTKRISRQGTSNTVKKCEEHILYILSKMICKYQYIEHICGKKCGSN